MSTHAPVQGKTVLDADALGRTLSRIAHEIIEGNPELDEVALVGIQTRGVPLAQRLAAVGAGRLEPTVGVERRTDADGVPRAVAVPPAPAGVDPVGGRHDREGIEHPQLVGRLVEDESMLLVQPPPAGDDLLRVAQLRGYRRATALDEEGVRPPSQLEVGLLHARDAIPSFG